MSSVRTSKRKPYPSDLSDAQWDLIKDLIPQPNPHPNLPKPNYERREIVNGILYLLRTGCQWRHLPHDFPKWTLVASYYYKWKRAGVLTAILDRLRSMARSAEGRNPQPTLGMIDSQSAKTTEVTNERGFDAGKKVKGRKRHIVVDVCGLILAVLVTCANVQDRDGAVPLVHEVAENFPSVEKILADRAYAGRVIDEAEAATGIDVEVTKRNDQVKGFVPVRLRWAVERTFGWLGRYRRTSKDYERYACTEEYVVEWVMVAIVLRRLAPSGTFAATTRATASRAEL